MSETSARADGALHLAKHAKQAAVKMGMIGAVDPSLMGWGSQEWFHPQPLGPPPVVTQKEIKLYGPGYDYPSPPLSTQWHWEDATPAMKEEGWGVMKGTDVLTPPPEHHPHKHNLPYLPPHNHRDLLEDSPPVKTAPVPPETVPPVVQPILPSATPTPAAGKHKAMGSILSQLGLGSHLAIPAAVFSWTKILEIFEKLDLWWISLSSPGCLQGCPGRNMPVQTLGHSPSSCPPGCPGYPLISVRRFIIFLFILVLLLVCYVGYQDSQGSIPICFGPCLDGSNCEDSSCNCTGSSGATCKCCCVLDGQDINSPWGFARLLWAWVSAHFSWLSSLQSFVSTLGGRLTVVCALLTWMTLSLGIHMTTIWQLFITLYAVYWWHSE
uniref:Large envelope protein n=1 Tax=Alewife hepatitis B virus TaxID=3066367 RepID=A0AA50A8T0_9HEPA|nr:surface protein [Alewife hepatitis B virus]